MTELRCVVCELTERNPDRPDYVTVSILDGFSLCLYCRVKVRDRWMRDRSRTFAQVITDLLHEFFDEVAGARS